jgi:hypothetical protein
MHEMERTIASLTSQRAKAQEAFGGSMAAGGASSENAESAGMREQIQMLQEEITALREQQTVLLAEARPPEYV